MAAAKRGGLRKLWLDVHLWIGVGLFLVLVPLGVTGSALVWGEGLDRLIHPHRFAVSGPSADLPPSVYVDHARAAFGERAVPAQLRPPQAPGQPVIVTGRVPGKPAPGQRPAMLTAWLDPVDGRVLDVADTRDSALGVLHRIHGTLMIPDIGRKVVGWLGWAMLVSCLTGLWLWWPRNGAVLKGLRWRRSPSTFDNLHHLVGFWICIPLAALSLTGVYISFPQMSRAVFGIPQPPARSPGGGPPPARHAALSPDQAVASALALAPGGRLASLTLPTEGRAAVWKAQFKVEGRKDPLNVEVADATGQASLGRGQAPSPDPLSRWMRRLHDGTDMGPVFQAVIFVAGLTPALLGVTGVVMWLRRQARRRRLRVGVPAAAE